MKDTGTAEAKDAPQPCPCCPVCNGKAVKRTTKLGEAPRRKFFRAED